MGERALFFDAVQIKTDGRSDRLVNVNGENLFIISQKNGCPCISGNQGADLHWNGGFVHE
jgi:hypothetical protein